MERLTSGGNANQDKNATKNPSHEKKNTLPYLLMGFNIGTDNALYVTGLMSGERKMLVKMLFEGIVVNSLANQSQEDFLETIEKDDDL